MESSADGKAQAAGVLGARELAGSQGELPEEVRGVVTRAIMEAEGRELRPPLTADSVKVEIRCQPEENAATLVRAEPAAARRREAVGSPVPTSENRPARVDESLARQEAHLRESTRRLFEPLEAYVKKELECFRERLKAEREERCDAIQQLSREMSDTRDALARKVAEIDDHISELLYRQLREEILQHSLRFGEELQRSQEDYAALAERFEHLREELLDRSALGDMLIEVGTRLKIESQQPTVEP